MSFCFDCSKTGDVMERHFRSNACITWAGIRGKWWKRRNLFELTDIGYSRKSEMRPYIEPKDLPTFDKAKPVVNLLEGTNV
jgi:hypothetical protein